MKYIERAYPWILIAPAVLPVVVVQGLIYPYLVPKTLLFYTLSFLALSAFLVLVAHGRTFYWARLSRKETWIPAALLLVAYATSLIGVGFYRSFWSLFVRGDGLLMLTCATVSFYLMMLAADRAFFKRLTRTVAVVGSAVALYGLGEALVNGGRIGSLLGNAAFFAGYLALSFFATIAAMPSLSTRWRRIAYFGALLQILAIIFSATRGTILALVLAGVAWLLALVLRGTPRYRAASLSALAVVLLCGGLFFTFRSDIARIPFAPIARVAAISTADQDVASRLFLWRNMADEIRKAPFAGVGAEHIDVLFNRFYDPSQIREEWFDRSHNAFLDYAAQYGVLGLLLYLALIALFFVSARRLAALGETRLAYIAALAALTYAAQNFFVFDTVSSLWLMLALLAGLLSLSTTDSQRTALQVPAWAQTTSWAAVAILAVLVIPVAVRPALAAYDLAQAYKYQITDTAKEIRYLSRGISLGTYGDVEYGYQVYDMYVHNQVMWLSGPARADAYQSSLTILTKNFNTYPYDARTALYLAHVLTLAPQGMAVDPELLSRALERTTLLSSKRAQAWYILANLSLSKANQYPAGSPERRAGYASAEETLRQYLALVPTIAAPHYVLAQLLYASGRAEAASAEAAKGKEGYTDDVETARRAAGYYETVRDWKEAAFFLGEIVRLDPTDVVSLYDLAKVSYLMGDAASAEVLVAELRKSNPRILETDPSFLSAITAYEQSRH
ncbi:MAG: O-antigen ligase family protein [Candidatus Paceibacterota bacterium]|jgi:O-antigen ligase